jgi:hypothetical protein
VKVKQGILNDIERLNLAILVLGSIAIIFIMRDFWYFFSFVVGSAIMTLNFRFLRRILEGTFSAAEVRKKALAIKLPLKFFALIALVVLVVLYGDIDAISFLLGLSTPFISIVLSQVFSAFSSPAERSKENGA